MKVLLVSFEFGAHVAGGLGRVINGVTEELRHQLEQLDVFLLYYNPLKLAMSGKLYRCDSADPRRLLQTFVWGSAEEQCAELMARERYDVVHVLSVNASIAKLAAGMERHVPRQAVVYSVHNLVKHEQGTRKNPSDFLELERLILEQASLVHVLNEATRSYLERAYPDLPRDKPVRVVGNGVRLEDLSPTDDAFAAALERRLQPGAGVVVCLSRWTHGKGLEHFVSAAERLLAAGHEAHFVLAGRKYLSWEKEWYSYVWEISRRARRLGDRLLVLGWLNEAQRNTLYQRADVCVMPSELEYYPYSMLEPAAAGTPLVCSDLPCVTELFAHERDCLLFRNGDAASLASGVERLLLDPEQARRLAARAKSRVAARCDWKRIADEYCDMYREASARGARDWAAA
ncbi:MAG: glycosyl transferase group 1 [Polyangiaceae bacterium]|nr:glycosyl transferase group 1 [Polyangiaceae bacterium]